MMSSLPCSHPVQLSEGTSSQLTLHGLQPYTQYWVGVEACTCFKVLILHSSLPCSGGLVSLFRLGVAISTLGQHKLQEWVTLLFDSTFSLKEHCVKYEGPLSIPLWDCRKTFLKSLSKFQLRCLEGEKEVCQFENMVEQYGLCLKGTNLN